MPYRILLIQPDSHIPKRLPPLGLMYLAAFLREQGDVTVKILDARRDTRSPRRVAEEMKRFQPDITGITGLQVEAPSIHRIARMAKKMFPAVPVVVGGPYASSVKERILVQDDKIDFAIAGEGETAFYVLVQSLRDRKKDLRNIHRLSYRNQRGQVVSTTCNETFLDMTTLPFPAWDLVDMEWYLQGDGTHTQNIVQIGRRNMNVMTSRGCPFSCTYCHNIFGTRIRRRSIDSVLAELEVLKETYGVEEVSFIDDVLNADRDWAMRLFARIIEKNLNLRFAFPNGLRADLMDEELIKKMKEAGIYLIMYAVETGSPEIQRRIKKNLDLEKTREIIACTVSQGILTGGFFMFGFEGETLRDMHQTIAFARSSPLHLGHFFYLFPFDGTAVHRNSAASRHIDGRTFESYSSLRANVSEVSDRTLRAIRKKAVQQFYFHPRRIVHILKALPQKSRLARYILITMKLALSESKKY